MLLQVPTLELMRLWGDLTAAYYGHASHGDTAEIYAYRFCPLNPLIDSPSASGSEMGSQAKSEREQSAGVALIELCKLFARETDSVVTINGTYLYDMPWLWSFNHRVHVKVTQ